MKLTELVDTNELQRLVEALSALSSSPLLVLDNDGRVIARAGEEQRRCHNQGNFSAGEGLARCAYETCPLRQGQTSLAVQVYGEEVGFVVGCGDDRAGQAVALLGDFVSRVARDEFELNSLSAEISDKYEEINLLYAVSSSIGTTFDIQQICDLSLQYALRVIEAGKAAVLLLDPNTQALRVVAAHGVPDRAREAIRVGEGISGRVVAEGKPRLIEAGQTLPPDQESERAGYEAGSFLSVPLICYTPERGERTLGVINLADKKSGMFTSGDLKLLTAIASQTAISIYKSQLLEELKEAERVKREIEIARRIQMSLLPESPPKVEGVELAGRCVPAREVGGDYYDFFGGEDRLGIIIADVSGHSVGSALMMAITRSVLRSEISREKSPAQVLASTNSIMYDDLTRAELFITVFYASYDPARRVLTYANGGHNPPFLWRRGEGRRFLLDAEGMLLGILKDVPYEERALELRPGDFLIFYTDGVTEARNEAGELFGEERLYQVVEENSHLSARELLDEIYRRVYEHSGEHHQRDDITLVVMKILE